MPQSKTLYVRVDHTAACVKDPAPGARDLVEVVYRDFVFQIICAPNRPPVHGPCGCVWIVVCKHRAARHQSAGDARDGRFAHVANISLIGHAQLNALFGVFSPLSMPLRPGGTLSPERAPINGIDVC